MSKGLETLKRLVYLFIENVALISQELNEKSKAIHYAELVAKDEVLL